MGATVNYSSGHICKYGKGCKMKCIALIVVINIAFGLSVYILNYEITTLKAELAISNDYINNLENDLNSCKGYVDFLKNGVEDMMKVCEEVKCTKNIKEKDCPK